MASNGLLLSDEDNESVHTFHWRTNYPIATYLVSLAIHPYSQYSDWYTPLAGGDPMEVAFYVFQSHMDDVQDNYALTVPMIGAFAQGYGVGDLIPLGDFQLAESTAVADVERD